MQCVQPKNSIIRWGIISAANICSQFIPPAQKSKRSEVIAIASRSLEKAENFGKEWGIPNRYGSYQELLEDKDIDAVYIPLPNSLHVEWALKAAAKGLHCLVEKPMSLDGAGVRQLEAAMKEHNVVIEEAYVHLHHPMLSNVRWQLKSIGTVIHLHGLFQSNMSDRRDHLIFKKDLGSGSLWMLGCYPISAFIFLLNQRPISVCAQYTPHTGGVDETMSAVIKFPDGVLASMTCSVAAFSETRLEITGERGVIKLDRARTFHVGQSDDNNRFEVITKEDGSTVFSVSPETGFEAQLRRFEESVLDGKEVAVSMEMSEWVADTLAACDRSAKEEKFVTL